MANDVDPREGKVQLRQSWDELLFLHWPIDPETVQQALPPGLTVDTYEGRAYLTLALFSLNGLRGAMGPSIPGLSSFLEVNFRTYVRAEGEAPGVWFFTLEAANRVAAMLGRRSAHLPYHYARMATRTDPLSGEIRYRSERKAPAGEPIGCSARYRTLGAPAPAVPGTLTYFLIERYLMFVQAKDSLMAGRVWHEPYQLRGVDLLAWRETILASEGFDRPEGGPLAHYTDGVDVSLYPMRKVTG